MTYLKHKPTVLSPINSPETSSANQATAGLAIPPPHYHIAAADQPALIQPKLTIGPANDKYEREADEMAALVAPNQPSPILQPKCADCEETTRLQRHPAAGISALEGGFSGGIAAPAAVTQQLQSSQSGGEPLPEGTQMEMERLFGQDFSGVRVHTDHRAGQMNRQINARAFTHGSNIYFNQGEYTPGSRAGRRLLAHELTHVMQQNGASPHIQRDLALEPPNPDAGVMGLLDPAQVSAALHYNLDRFANAEELRMMRDVLGLAPDVRQLIDEEFVQAVARWQASHNLPDVDGKLGPDTVASLVAEYRAEAGRAPAMTAHADRLAIRTRPNEWVRNVDVNGHNDLFDAVLSHRDARLTLVMRVDFQFHAGPVGTALNAAQQRSFIARFRRDVRRVWAEMYALVPVGDVPNNYLDTYYADIRIVNTNRNPHFVAHISNTSGVYEDTDPPGPIGSGGPYVERDDNWLRLGDEDTGLYSGISQADASGTSYPMQQYTAAHEFGHMMGLSHIHCDGGMTGNCYGTTNAERANIMGLGNRVTRGNYAPFITAINRITGTRWRAR